MDFHNQVIVVTGGSKGFGKGLARAFVQHGAKVIITCPNEAELIAAAAQIGAAYFVADASSHTATAALAEHVINQYGKIDVWLNNAGVQIAPTLTEDVDVEKLHRLFDVNFFGYFYGCMVALKVMKGQGHGLIINVNSTAGLSGKPSLSAYVASKFAVKGLSESIRQEINDTGVHLFQIFPGGMQTDIYHEEIPTDIHSYMHIDYAIDKVMTNLKAPAPEPDLVINRPSVG